MIKKIFRKTGFAVLILIVLICIYLLSAFILSRIEVSPELNKSNDVTIYIKSNGVHTDIIVPVKSSQKDWSKEVKFENTNSKDTIMQYLAFGWGDRRFYLETPTWKDLKFTTAFTAIFGLNKAAIHTTFYKAITEDNKCKKIMISNEQYFRLINYINEYFITENNHYINIKTNAHYCENDAFYEAKGRYNLFYTCNTWTNNGLKACGQKACLWTPFESSIFYHYDKKE